MSSSHHLGILTRSPIGLDSNNLDFFDQYKEKISSLCPSLKIDIIRLKAEGNLLDNELNQLSEFDILILSEGKLLNYIGPLPSLPKLKWVSTFYAGVDNLLKTFTENNRPNYIVSRNQGYFDQQMAEYVVGMIISRERQFHQLKEYQQKKIWANNLIKYKTLSGKKFGIIGFGSIGKTIAENLKAFKMPVIAFVRTLPAESVDSNYLYVQLTNDLNYLLSNCDYVCSVLPKTKQTDGFYDGEVLKACSNKKSIFINIGRGNVIKEETILRSLDEGWISHAILDVFESEPLATSSKLWHHPDVTITPHISGVYLDFNKLAENFSRDYELFREGRPLKNLVNFEKGY